MKKLIEITILATIFFAGCISLARAQCVIPAYYEIEGTSCASGGNYNVMVTSFGPYNDSASAEAAAQALYDSITPVTSKGIQPGAGGTTGWTAKWRVYHQDSGNCTWQIWDYFYRPCTLTSDTDGDGLEDHCDPYPNDPQDVFFNVFSYQGTRANPTYLTIVTARGDYISFGTYDSGETDWLDVVDPWVSQTELANMGFCTDFSGGSTAGTDSIGGGQIADESLTSDETTSGVDNTGNTTDQDYLADIVENTRRIADNQGTIADNQTALEEAIQDMRDAVIMGGGIGATTEQTQQAIVDAENQIAEENQEQVDDYLDEISGQAVPTLEDIGAVGSQTGDVPDEDTLSTFFDTVIAASPVATYLGNTTLSLSGSECSITWNYNGNPIELTMCNFQPQVSQFGAILLGFAGLWSLIYVFRR